MLINHYHYYNLTFTPTKLFVEHCKRKSLTCDPEKDVITSCRRDDLQLIQDWLITVMRIKDLEIKPTKIRLIELEDSDKAEMVLNQITPL